MNSNDRSSGELFSSSSVTSPHNEGGELLSSSLLLSEERRRTRRTSDRHGHNYDDHDEETIVGANYSHAPHHHSSSIHQDFVGCVSSKDSASPGSTGTPLSFRHVNDDHATMRNDNHNWNAPPPRPPSSAASATTALTNTTFARHAAPTADHQDYDATAHLNHYLKPSSSSSPSRHVSSSPSNNHKRAIAEGMLSLNHSHHSPPHASRPPPPLSSSSSSSTYIHNSEARAPIGYMATSSSSSLGPTTSMERHLAQAQALPSSHHHYATAPYHHFPIMAPSQSSDASSYSNYPPMHPYSYAVHPASFESTHGGSSAPSPYMTYSGGHPPPTPTATTTVIAYPPPPHPYYHPHPSAHYYTHAAAPPPPWMMAAHAASSLPPPNYVTDITPRDVLCGRGGATNSHSGNRAFRLLVKKHQGAYLRAKKRDKPSVASRIVRTIRNRGGRFLRKVEQPLGPPPTMGGRRHHAATTVLWLDIGDDRAREKTCQALREGAPELRRRRSKSFDDDNNVPRDDGPMEEDEEDDESLSAVEDGGRHNRTLKDDSPRKGMVRAKEERRQQGHEARELNARNDSTDIRDRRIPVPPDSGDISSSIMAKGPTVIRPSARLMKRWSTTEFLTMQELTPSEREIYLRDFVPPPESSMRTTTNRREAYRIPRHYEPVAEEDSSMDKDDDDSWTEDE